VFNDICRGVVATDTLREEAEGNPTLLMKLLCYVWLAIPLFTAAAAAEPERPEWRASAAAVVQSENVWEIRGRNTAVRFDSRGLGISVQREGSSWAMSPSCLGDFVVNAGGKAVALRLADAKSIRAETYDTGFKTGVKLTLHDWPMPEGATAGDLAVYLTVCLEGADEELVCDVAIAERGVKVRQLDWPGALDASAVDYTVLPNGRGNLLPRDWQKEYSPVRKITPEGRLAESDHSVIVSHLIESWSMSWWGFQRGESAMMALVETPDDGSYQFSHPAGGPTVIGPRWLSSLGRFSYPRSVRFCFFEHGNYVTMAKRYRRHALESGLHVSLKQKIARTPAVGELIGVPQSRVSILRNLTPESDRYDTAHPENNYRLYTFDQRAEDLRSLNASGVDRAMIMISGWPHLGYDRQHPDPLPPPEAAGGWEGLKRLAATCRELGYLYMFHDQYRDYYADAPSYQSQFAIHEEDDSVPAKAFAGSRFGDWKEGAIPFMRHWDGGKQTYLNARYQLGHLRKNYELFFGHGIRPGGIYIDVVGYVPPDEDYNPEHPTTRREAMEGQIAMLNWSRQHLGVVATEAGADWVVPYVDTVNDSGATGKTIPVPLYHLVYHDAVLTSFGLGQTSYTKRLLRGLLYGGAPELPVGLKDPKALGLIKQMSALHRRVALLEMTNHEFLDTERNRERTTFADGTTVTVDWAAEQVDVRENPAQSAEVR
jgi:hypothetical protein